LGPLLLDPLMHLGKLGSILNKAEESRGYNERNRHG
jgi:hypothetical protein